MNCRTILQIVIPSVAAACATDTNESVVEENDAAVAPDDRSASVLADMVQTFRNQKSDKCMGVDNGSDAHGAFIKQFSCNGDANQSWNVQNDGDIFKIVNKGSGKCLGVDNASEARGADIRQFDCDSSQNQRWFFDDSESGGVEIRNRKSDLCVGVDEGSSANGAQLKQFGCDDNPNQAWK